MKAARIFKILTLSDISLCRCLGLRPEDRLSPSYDRMIQKRARFGYIFGILIVGIITYFTKFFGDQMFYFLRNSFSCTSHTYIYSCFTLVMIYRISFTIFFYHLIMMLVNASNSKGANFINDFCWLPKVVVFIEIFFICCLIPNGFFEFCVMIFKYITMVTIIINLIIINDGLFFFFNKKRFAGKAKFSKIWSAFCYAFGVLCFAAGLALFIFCFIWYQNICTDYKAINATLFSLSCVTVIIGIAKYKFRVEVTHSLIFFFVLSIINYGILGGSPYTKCVNVSNRDFIYSYSTSAIDSIFSKFKRSPFCIVYVSFHIKC